MMSLNCFSLSSGFHFLLELNLNLALRLSKACHAYPLIPFPARPTSEPHQTFFLTLNIFPPSHFVYHLSKMTLLQPRSVPRYVLSFG